MDRESAKEAWKAKCYDNGFAGFLIVDYHGSLSSVFMEDKSELNAALESMERHNHEVFEIVWL